MSTTPSLPNQPKTIKGFCQIGAVFAPDHGSVGGFHSRQLSAPDANNLLPQTYYYKSNASVSDRLRGASQAAGGILPEANRYIGAPLCTFAYGGIPSGETHPQLDLIQGPALTDTVEVKPGIIEAYNPTYTSTAKFSTTTGDGTLAPTNTDSARALPPPQFPTVPATTGYPFTKATTPNTTYNIWKLVNLDKETENSLTYKKNWGPQFPSGYNAARIRQNTSVDGSMCLEVTASNCTAQLSRVFPISKDLLYSGATLYYPHPILENLSRPITAVGGENCGFQLHFQYATVTQMNNQTSSELTGGIGIEWGVPKGKGGGRKAKNLIQNFNLILYPGRVPQLYFLHPRTKSWQAFPLKGPAFDGGEYDIYVHYCGPHMMVGFDTDPAGWNCFTPPNDKTDFQTYYYPYLSPEAEIGIIFDNITTVFQYGPIAFNNYHPEKVLSPKDFTNGLDLGTVAVNFTVPLNRTELAAEGLVNSQFQSLRFNRKKSISGFTSPTIYGDSRSSGIELSYHQTSAGPGQEDDGDFEVQGIVRFDTTIEGPQFLQIRNPTPAQVSAPVSPPSDLIRSLSWGDLSEFLTGWSANYSMENDNHSFLAGKAEVTLVNLALTVGGRQILSALETNIFSVTLGAGEDAPVAFFQGVTESVETTYTDEGSVTTLICTDIASWVMSEVMFSSSLYFSMMRYVDIIDTCVAMSGLGNWYVPYPTPSANSAASKSPIGQSPFVDALILRLGIAPYEQSLATNCLRADVKTSIGTVLNAVLTLIIAPGALPAFFWDADAKRLRLAWRNDPAIQDELSFLGKPDEYGVQRLPSNASQGKHGVLRKGYTSNTSLKQLHAGVTIFGLNHYSEVMQYKKYFPKAYRQVGFNLLNNLTSATDVGWVGVRKYLVDETQVNNLPDQLSLNKYGSVLADNYLRQTYGFLSFECWVTRPLFHYGTFRVFTLEGSQATDAYFYKTVNYKFDKQENTLSAQVAGEILPPILKITR